MFLSAPWLMPIAIITVAVFGIMFLGWLEAQSRLEDGAGVFLLAMCLVMLFMADGSLITLLVI